MRTRIKMENQIQKVKFDNISVGDVYIRLNSGFVINAVNMGGIGIHFGNNARVIKVKPTAVEGNTVIFEEVNNG